jgi:hypothetical protein
VIININETGFLGRRELLQQVLILTALGSTAGCATLGNVGSLDLVGAIRQLLSLSTKNALAKLVAPDGFISDTLTKINLPPELGGAASGQLLAGLLQSTGMMKQLESQANKAAEYAAGQAAPLLADGIKALNIQNPLAILKGDPQAATQLLKQATSGKLIDLALPLITKQLGGGGIVGQVLSLAKVMDFGALSKNISGKTVDSVFSAIGREEAGIRSDPLKGGSELLKTVFGSVG